VLALYEASGEARWAEQAAALGRLFQTRLFDPATGTLAERFDERWACIEPAVLEPGHHFEWAWLLGRLRAATGQDYAAQASALCDFAERAGIDPATGLAWDEIDVAGRILK